MELNGLLFGVACLVSFIIGYLFRKGETYEWYKKGIEVGAKSTLAFIQTEMEQQDKKRPPLQ